MAPRYYTDKELRKISSVMIIANGLTQEEEKEIRDMVKRLKRKRSHEQNSRLLHRMIFES